MNPTEAADLRAEASTALQEAHRAGILAEAKAKGAKQQARDAIAPSGYDRAAEAFAAAANAFEEASCAYEDAAKALRVAEDATTEADAFKEGGAA